MEPYKAYHVRVKETIVRVGSVIVNAPNEGAAREKAVSKITVSPCPIRWMEPLVERKALKSGLLGGEKS